MSSLYKSEIGKKEILELYDQKLEGLKISFQYKKVATTFGETNVIVTGSPENPPLMIVHGSNGCAPISLEAYPNLSEKFQVFAVDVLAQPNKSAQNRVSMKGLSYGYWMNEVLEKLQLKKVTLVGFSFGGLIIFKTLIQNEKAIKESFVVAPAYIVNGSSMIALLKVFIPMKRYIKTKKMKYVERFLSTLFTDKDAFAVCYLSKVFLYFKMDFTPVPIISKSEARKIKTPITIIAAKEDILFPGEKMIKKAVRIFPSLKQTILLEESKHVQCSRDNLKIERLILEEEV